MSEKENKNSNAVNVRFVPFAGGIFAIYAFFWPEGYGAWLGTIVHAFRKAAGL